MTEITVRKMVAADRNVSAELICLSHNTWYRMHAMQAAFVHIPQSGEFFFDLYESLDGAYGIVAECNHTSQIAGLSFYTVRPTHVSVAMMTVHPNYFQQGVGKALLRHITDVADSEEKPVRLVSSALNLDSFSLYNRTGFRPRYVYQDMLLQVPEKGISIPVSEQNHIRVARSLDVSAMAELEHEINGMQRTGDYAHLVNSKRSRGQWNVSICEDAAGGINGFIVSCEHPDIHMLGPAVARSQDQLLSLIFTELDRYRGHSVLQLVPADCSEIIEMLYNAGGRNVELHFYQVRGQCNPFKGLYTPTYMFETG
jgi:GNAT superfamily N-acetyltransferase